MTTSAISVLFLSLLFSTGSVLAQPTSGGVSLNVAQVGSAIPVTLASATRMAVDRDGNAFIVQDALGPSMGTVLLVYPDGTQIANFMVGAGFLGHPTTHPGDGRVYVAAWLPGLQQSTLYRLQAGLLPWIVGTIPLVAHALAFNLQGALHVGAPSGPQGAGVYKLSGLVNPPQFLGALLNCRDLAVRADDQVFASNGSILHLIAGGTATPHWTPQNTLPGSIPSICSLARGPWNQTGIGLVAAVNENIPSCFCVFAQVVHLSPSGVTTMGAVLTSPDVHVAMATDSARGLYFLVDSGAVPNMQRTLWRTEEVASSGAPASLQSNASGQVLTTTIDGPVGVPFLLGFMPNFGQLPPGFFAPGYGLVELHPWDPMYSPAVDGLGLFGAPSPFGVIPGSSVAVLPATIPLGLTGTLVSLQAVLPGLTAPNGLFYLSNTLTIALP
ncbi:MAG: hypothetical protein EXS14_01620 [Planctomycetes bacterium]|nr:hypothetical protein [Planctomycetota bacterium]